MNKLTLFAVVVTAGVCGLAETSNAVPMPCTGDRLVKIVEIPAVNQPRDFTVELGYKFPGCFSDGEWIGYVNSEKYIKLNPTKSAAILEMAGLKEFPPTPSRLQYPWEALGLEIIEGSVLIAALLYGFGIEGIARRKKKRLITAEIPPLGPPPELQDRKEPTLP